MWCRNDGKGNEEERVDTGDDGAEEVGPGGRINTTRRGARHAILVLTGL